MNNQRILTSLVLMIALAAQANTANLKVALDARDIRSKRVHTELSIPAKAGPLTLVFPKWLPGEHGPTGPLESMIGLEIRAGGQLIPWSRDPFDMYALRVTVPAGTSQLQVKMESGL